MTDKEQIIIDGVNIIDCDDYYVEQETGQIKCDLSGEYCRENKNCFYKQLKRKEQECEEYKKRAVCFKDVNKQLGYKYLTIKQECEEYKKQLMQKSEVDMFFNTPIEGWSNDPCGICPHKAENEELKKEIINKNEKIKELRFSVSDLTNRLCSLNTEKSFRIVDLEQTLDEIKKVCIEDTREFADGTAVRYDSLDDILDIISKAKGEGND